MVNIAQHSKEVGGLKEHPILFSDEMVRAILDGRKTMTRRVVKPQPNTIRWCPVQSNRTQGWQDEHGSQYNCPYGVEGDRLWVRETFYSFIQNGKQGVIYRADTQDGYFSACETMTGGYHSACVHNPECEGCSRERWKPNWRPSIHMPRWASRITVEITDIRVERLQEISEEDAIAEGMQKSIGGLWCGAPHRAHGCPKQHNTAVEAFADLWDSLNAKRGYGWDVNPRVWVIEFRGVEA